VRTFAKPLSTINTFVDDHIPLINLSYNTSLKSLDFWSWSLLKLTAYIDTLLSQITSPNLERIKLTVYIDTLVVETMDWGMFVNSFSRPQFPRLRTVELEFFGSVTTLTLSIIEAKLAECGPGPIVVVPPGS
jgi:hypothetical protein